MNRPIACCLLATFCILVPATAFGIPEVGEKHNGWSLCDERYLGLYEQAHKAGLDVGRNRVDDGKLLQSGEVVPEPHPCAQANRLDAMLHPPAPEPIDASSVSTAPAPAPVSVAATPVTSGGGYVSSSTVQCESGGDYSINTGNGYYGAYQFDSGTWDAYGDPAYGEASEAPAAVQDAAAASVPYDAWPNC